MLSFLSRAFSSALQKMRAFYYFSIAPRTTRAQTEGVATEINDWASLVNNGAWSGGLVLAIQILKAKSGVSGLSWLAVTGFQVLLGAMAASLAIAAVLIAGERVSEDRSGKSRFWISALFFVFLAFVGWGFLETLWLVFMEI